MGFVVLEPNGGQVPWHNHEQEEIYFIVAGEGEMCLGEERQTLSAGQTVFIPSWVFHQLTNTGDTPMQMVYCYGPAGDVAHWKQELAGTLRKPALKHHHSQKAQPPNAPNRRSPNRRLTVGRLVSKRAINSTTTSKTVRSRAIHRP